MRMTTGIERYFRPLRIQGYAGPQIYKEVYMHYIHFLNEDGTVQRSKLDKTTDGKFFKEAVNNTERSMWGEAEYTFPDGNTKRLLALGTDMNGQPVLPQV